MFFACTVPFQCLWKETARFFFRSALHALFTWKVHSNKPFFHHREFNSLLISDFRLMCSTTQVRRHFLCCCTESLFFFFFTWLVFVHLPDVLVMHINHIIEELQKVVTLNMRTSCQFCWSSMVYQFNDTMCPYEQL